MGQQIQVFVPIVAAIVAGPAMLCCQPVRAIPVSEAQAGLFNFDIKFPSSSKDTTVCPRVCSELEQITELPGVLKHRCTH